MSYEPLSVASDSHGAPLVEGAPGQSVMASVNDVAAVLEACLGHRIDLLLLYAENLTDGFFDLSSGEAGVILQKLRNYGIRTAVVVSPTTQMSHRFKELVEEESRGPHFRLFPSRESALEWLSTR